MALGSREAPGARRIGEPLRRHLMGRVYNILVRFLGVPGVADTQCGLDRKSTRLNSSHALISYAVFCLKKKIPSSAITQNNQTTHDIST